MIEIKENLRTSLQGLNFIDLFCGLGGFRLALESFGANCVFSSDIDNHVRETYKKNFGEYPEGDITKIEAKDVPYHDILCAGFPCQAFSISGKQKGFEDTRGTLFFDVVRIAKYHQPKIMLLENVKNLKQHDSGKTFEVIRNTLDEIGYKAYYDVLNASNYGIPQSRERIYIVCMRKDIDIGHFNFPLTVNKNISVQDVLLKNGEEKKYIINKPYKLKDSIKNTQIGMFSCYNKPIRVGTVNKGGQGDRIYDAKGHAITLSAEGGGTGAKTGLYYIDNTVRKLHPRECARLMGFPEEYQIHDSPSQAHKQFGNSVVVDVLQYIVKEIVLDGGIKNG